MKGHRTCPRHRARARHGRPGSVNTSRTISSAGSSAGGTTDPGVSTWRVVVPGSTPEIVSAPPLDKSSFVYTLDNRVIDSRRASSWRATLASDCAESIVGLNSATAVPHTTMARAASGRKGTSLALGPSVRPTRQPHRIEAPALPASARGHVPVSSRPARGGAYVFLLTSLTLIRHCTHDSPTKSTEHICYYPFLPCPWASGRGDPRDRVQGAGSPAVVTWRSGGGCTDTEDLRIGLWKRR